MTKPLLCLVMIVRDEAATIEKVLESWKPYIDRFCIVDTGSVDDTIWNAKCALEEVEGTFFSGEKYKFKDFSTNRNQALQLASEKGCEFMVMPNGDRLEGGAALRAQLEALRDSSFNAFKVRITPGHYYHPLVIRSGSDWKWHGRTHEYLSGSNEGPQLEGVKLVRDRAHRDAEGWRKRWKRDLELLHLDRMDDETNPRVYFYLGQTHECLADISSGEEVRTHRDAATKHYRRRAAMGGYHDEKFEAALRVARLLDKRGRTWEDIMEAYLEAHVIDPKRAEPLYEIARHYYDKGDQHALTYLFASRAASIKKPTTDLFLDEEIYAWKAADLAAISGFYIGEREAGVAFADKAIAGKPDDQRLRMNRAFYAKPISQLVSTRFKTIECPVPAVGTTPKRVAMNPSIMYYAGWLVNVRLVNYRIIDGRYFVINQDKPEELHNADDHHPIDTINVICDLDENFNVVKSTTITELPGAVPERTKFPVHGFEDMRIFHWPDDTAHWHAFATARDLSPDGKAEQCLIVMDPTTWEIVDVQPMRGPWSDQHQKNWLPEELGTRILYSTHPYQSFPTSAFYKGTWAGEIKSPGILRGGGGVVDLHGDRQGFDPRFTKIWIVHESIDFRGRTYLHRFVGVNHHGQLKMSEPFYFKKLGIEFCAGLAINDNNGQLVASFSVDDATAELAIFNVRDVLRMLTLDVP